MKLDIRGLIEGVKNSYFPSSEIKLQIEETAAERIKICEGCSFYSPNAIKAGLQTVRPDVYCVDCGCNLHFKSRCLSCHCPQEKWGATLTAKEEEVLNAKLNEG